MSVRSLNARLERLQVCAGEHHVIGQDRDRDRKRREELRRLKLSLGLTKALARELDCTESTVNEMVRRGVIPLPLRLSSGWVRWRWADVDMALQSLRPGDTPGDAGGDPYLLG